MGTIWLEAESMGELILPWLTKAGIFGIKQISSRGRSEAHGVTSLNESTI